MIKAEKTGNKMELEIKGGSHDLICEFDEVLKAMYKVLDIKITRVIWIQLPDRRCRKITLRKMATTIW